MNSRNPFIRSSIVFIILIISLIAASLACDINFSRKPISTPDDAAETIAVLSSINSHLMTQVAAINDVIDYQATRVASHEMMISYLATHMPVQRITPVRPTFTPSWPVIGMVDIEAGICCVGGTVGETIQVNVTFDASSPYAEVTEMRTRTGGLSLSENEMADAEWEPFSHSKTFFVPVFINWVGFYVNVQFRDAQGNLSAVHYDDISVEGHPPTPTLTPTP